MVNYVATSKKDAKVIKEMCLAHITRVREVELSSTDECILMIECSFWTWLQLRKVLPLDKKPVLLHTAELES